MFMHSDKVNEVIVAGGDPRCADAVVEVPVLLEAHVLQVLETAACQQGMTAGVLVRRLIRDFLSSSDAEPPTETAEK